MSSPNKAQNLSFSINLPKSSVDSTDIIQSVNETFAKFCSDFKLHCNTHFFKHHKSIVPKNETSPTMQSEKTIFCEINAGLWDKAIASSLSSITFKSYPHFVVVQRFINYLFNSNSSVNIGLLEEFFWELLLTHSPKPELFDYYHPILFHRFLSIYKKKVEDQNLFLCIIDALTTCLKNPEFSLPNFESSKYVNSEQQLLEGLDHFNGAVFNKFPLKEPNIMVFEDLPWYEKIKRCLIGLNFVYNILEIDFALWLEANGSKPFSLKKDNRPLIFHCLWREVRDVGLINKDIIKVLNAFKLFEEWGGKFLKIKRLDFLPHFDVFKKIINLLAEVFRYTDRTENLKYPFIGVKLNNFARELSLKLHEYLFDPNCENPLLIMDEIILNLKPDWFRLILCSYLISNIIGSQCPPDLTGAHDVLEAIEQAKKEDKTAKRIKKIKPINLFNLSERHKKLKSINAKLSNGNTLLQTACEENNVREIKGLFKSPDLDLNATNHEGWTALHIAAYKGYKEIVNELLKFRPHTGRLQRPVDTRARGPDSSTPLMCAASEGHAEICRMLLEHTGSVLLEDINESNQTPLELAKNEDVMKIMNYYVDNIVRTPHSRKNVNFDEKYNEMVIKLCVEMIHSYFCTYRTWDVYKCLKNRQKGYSKNLKTQPDLDYERYYRDIKRNIYSLRKLTPVLEDLEEFKSSYEIFTRILSFNKSC